MSRGPEGRFKTKVDKLLPKSVYHQAMNVMFSNGTPDRYYEGRSKSLWVEYKWIPKPQNIKPIDLCSPLQARWIQRARANGVAVWVVVGSPAGAAISKYDGLRVPMEEKQFLYGHTDTQVAYSIERFCLTNQ